MPGSAPAASTKGRMPGGAQGWQQELTAVCHSWHKHCEQGASLAPLGKARLPMLIPLQQPLTALPLAWRGQGWAAAPHCWVPGCRRGSLGSHVGQLWLCRGSSFLTSCQAVWQGQEYLPARTLPAPRQRHCGGDDAVPAPQLVQISQHRIDVSAGTAMPCGGSDKGTFSKALLPSPLSFASLLPQVKTNPTLPGQGRRVLVRAEVPMVFVVVGHPQALTSQRGRSCRVALPFTCVTY